MIDWACSLGHFCVTDSNGEILSDKQDNPLGHFWVTDMDDSQPLSHVRVRVTDSDGSLTSDRLGGLSRPTLTIVVAAVACECAIPGGSLTAWFRAPDSGLAADRIQQLHRIIRSSMRSSDAPFERARHCPPRPTMRFGARREGSSVQQTLILGSKSQRLSALNAGQ